MTNAQRRQIINDAKLQGYQGSYVDLFRQADASSQAFVASTPDQIKEGLRPFHQAGNTEASMVFTDVPPNTPFNTVGMKAPIDIKKYDEQGHLVKSYESVPPGIQSLDTGPATGTVLETPARMQGGDFTDSIESADIDETLDAVTLERYLADTRGQKPEYWRATADTLAFHESGPHQRMDPEAVQDDGGPGRGMLQFEPDALETAQTRHATVARKIGLQPDPEIMEATSADQLSKDQQYSLMYSDMIENPELPLKDYATGKMSIMDLWLRGHKKVEAEGDRESFEESRQAAKTELSKYSLRFGGLQKRGTRKMQRGSYVPKSQEDYDYRIRMYNDSLALSKATQKQIELMGELYTGDPEELQDPRIPLNTEWNPESSRWELSELRDMDKDLKFSSVEDARKSDYWTKQDEKLYDYYINELKIPKSQIGIYSSSDVFSSKIKPTHSFYDGRALSPYYQPPKQKIKEYIPPPPPPRMEEIKKKGPRPLNVDPPPKDIIIAPKVDPAEEETTLEDRRKPRKKAKPFGRGTMYRRTPGGKLVPKKRKFKKQSK